MSLAPRESAAGVTIRPLEAGDRDAFADLFARLSPRSRHRRYLSPKPALTPAELTRLTDVDQVDHLAVVAVHPLDGLLLGAGRFVRVAGEPQIADVAVEVADEWQGIGIGSALAAHVVQSARARGYERLVATTLWENHPARRLLRRLGFRAQASSGAIIDLELTLGLA